MSRGSRSSVRYWLVAAMVMGLAMAGLAVGHALAADPSGPVQGIQVSPVLIDLNADKGNSYNLKITVTNVTDGPLVLKSDINDFKAKDETGDPEVILDTQDEEPTYSLRSWIAPIPSLTLQSKQSQSLTIPVNIPSDAEAGGHYGVVRFSGTPPNQSGGNVSIAASVGVLVLARVNGAITEAINVKSFNIEKNGKPAGFIQSGPFAVVERFENTGNVHVKPTGTVTIKNMFGGTIATLPVNNPAKNVLPSSIRRFSENVNKKWLFGRYSVHLDATYGYTNKVISTTTTFWVIPYALIAALLVVLVLLILVLRFLIKRHNEKIINKALQGRRH